MFPRRRTAPTEAAPTCTPSPTLRVLKPRPPEDQSQLIPLRLPRTDATPFSDKTEVPFVCVDNDAHSCPFDGAAAFFVLYNVRGIRAPGVYVWSIARKEHDRVAALDDLPVGEWCYVLDADGFPLPLRMCRSAAGTITAIWSRQVI